MQMGSPSDCPYQLSHSIWLFFRFKVQKCQCNMLNHTSWGTFGYCYIMELKCYVVKIQVELTVRLHWLFFSWQVRIVETSCKHGFNISSPFSMINLQTVPYVFIHQLLSNIIIHLEFHFRTPKESKSNSHCPFSSTCGLYQLWYINMDDVRAPKHEVKMATIWVINFSSSIISGGT